MHQIDVVSGLGESLAEGVLPGLDGGSATADACTREPIGSLGELR